MSFAELQMFIVELADFSEFLPILLFIFLKQYKLFPILLFSLLIHVFLEQYTLYLADQKQYNLDIYHVIGLLELIFISAFYKRNTSLPKSLYYLFFLVVIIYVFNSLFWEQYWIHINAFGRSLSSLFLLLLGFNYLFNVYKEEKILNLHRSGFFIINAGLMFYFATSFFTLLFSRKILEVEFYSWFGATWNLHSLADIIRSIIIALGIIVSYYSSNTSQQ